MTQEREKELLNRLKEGIISCDEDMVVEAAHTVVEEGFDALKAIFDGMVPGMEYVGELYERQEYFIPELLMSTEAMYAGLNILRPHVARMDFGVDGVVVMGVVHGDVHDIGKNIVKVMFEVAGFEVHDLGRDVPLEYFVDEQLRCDADMVCLSAMMTTTMVGMREVIRRIKEKSPEAKIMIGGAPVTGEIAHKYGADGFAEDAGNALKDAIRMLSMLRKMRRQSLDEKVK
ncbi:MAG: cobalamin-dependent protein [Bacillota bacterium]